MRWLSGLMPDERSEFGPDEQSEHRDDNILFPC